MTNSWHLSRMFPKNILGLGFLQLNFVISGTHLDLFHIFCGFVFPGLFYFLSSSSSPSFQTDLFFVTDKQTNTFSFFKKVLIFRYRQANTFSLLTLGSLSKCSFFVTDRQTNTFSLLTRGPLRKCSFMITDKHFFVIDAGFFK